MIPTSVRIFVCTERQDMRRSFDALALVVRDVLALDRRAARCSYSRASAAIDSRCSGSIEMGTASSTSGCTELISNCQIPATPRARSRCSMCVHLPSFSEALKSAPHDRFNLTKDPSSITTGS